MRHIHHDPRTKPVPPEIAEAVRQHLATLGPRGAAARLGISRGAVLSVAAGMPALPGTLALLREALSERASA